MQKSKYPGRRTKTLLYPSANHDVNLYPSECERHRRDTRIGTHVYLRKPFQTTGVKNRSWVELVKARTHGSRLTAMKTSWRSSIAG